MASTLERRSGAKPPSSPTPVLSPWRPARLQGMEHLGAVAHRLADGAGTHAADHELLQVHAVVGMGAAVEDVHHGHRQPNSPLPRER